MFTTVSVQLPTHILPELIQRLERSSGSKDVSAAIASAVELWLTDQKQFPKKADPDGLHGYQWKCLFLRPGDKQFKLAGILRKEVLRAQPEVNKPLTKPIAVPASTEEAPAATPPTEKRDTSQREDWTLPERRKWRIRLEDIAFD